MREQPSMGFRQRHLRTPALVVLSIVIGIAAGWIGAQRSAGLDPGPAREGRLRPRLQTTLPPTAEAAGGRAAMLSAEQGMLCVANVDGLRVRQAPGNQDQVPVLGALSLEAKVWIQAGPQAVAGSAYTWVYIESAGIRPAHIKGGWVAYELLYCAR